MFALIPVATRHHKPLLLNALFGKKAEDNNYAAAFAALHKALKGQLAVFLSFNESPEALVRLKELEFVKGDLSTPNPLHFININTKKANTISCIPTKGREGESIKLSIEPKTGFKIQSIEVFNENNQSIQVERNELAPYASLSYHFFMPNSEVSVKAKFIKE